MRNQILISWKNVFELSVTGLISGISSFCFILTINKIMAQTISQEISRENNYILVLTAVIVTYIISRRFLSEGVIKLSQNLYWELRSEIIARTIKAPYIQVNRLKEKIHSVLTVDINHITNASLLIINVFTSIILIIACFLYMLYLSSILFLISISAILLGVVIYFLSSKKGSRHFMLVRDLEESFLKIFNSVLNGIKEIKTNHIIGEKITSTKLAPIIDRGKKKSIIAYLNFLDSQLISQIIFYILITFLLIKASPVFGIKLDIIIGFIFVLLYLLGPIVNVITSIPIISRGLISYNILKDIRQELDAENVNYISLEEAQPKFNFKSLEFKGYHFSFGEDFFDIGPIDLKLNKNEISFIYGGNGAGKTTMVNTLLNLYATTKGKMLLNGKEVSPSSIHLSNNLIAPVFYDFFLFDEFYGVEGLDENKLNFFLKLFELENKVCLTEKRELSTIDLSAGQRKRLALIIALMTEKPILILDEWAADQEPLFRKKFYTEILPYLKLKENKTILAITHDDKYFSCSDRLYKMEYGTLTEVTNTFESL